MLVFQFPVRFQRVVWIVVSILVTTASLPALRAQDSSIKVGRMAAVSPSSATPSSQPSLLTYGVYPQTQTLVDAWVEYNTTTCAEISMGSWAVTTTPKAGTTAFGSVTGQLNNGDCPGVAFTFAALYYTWTSTKPTVLADTFAATWTSPDFVIADSYDLNLVHLQINLVSPPPNNQYTIDATPTMPVIQATAQVLNAVPDPTPTTVFTWTETISVKKGTGQTVSYGQFLQQSATTTGTAVFTLATVDPATIVGGNLTLKIAATVNGFNMKASTPAGLKVVGTNPQRSNIQTVVSATVPTISLDGLVASDVTDDTERIACQESKQVEFKAAADGGIGPVLISFDNGVGIFQLTSPSPFGDPNLLFNWQSNTKKGLAVFSGKIPGAKGYPGQLRVDAQYTAVITNTVNPIRVANKLMPITTTPAPAFTKTGVIGSTPTDTLLEDATRGFNGYGGAPLYGHVLHEFEPDLNFLETVPDNQLPGLGTNPLVWTRVPIASRGASGDPNYVANVTARSPQCGN